MKSTVHFHFSSFAEGERKKFFHKRVESPFSFALLAEKPEKSKCRTPKEAYFLADKIALFGRDRPPAECDCRRAQRMEYEASEQRRKHRDKVE